MDSNEVLQDLINLRMKGRHRFWETFMIKYNCQVICELGVRQGRNFRRMIDHRPREAVAVDSWVDDGVRSRNDIRVSQGELDQQCEDFKDWMAKFPFVKIIRDYTFEAVKQFPDEYFDFIYIDADHSYEGCKRDIEDWYPKLKHGGFLVGDDYREHWVPTVVRFGVIKAVDEFAKNNNLELLLGIPRNNWAIIKP